MNLEPVVRAIEQVLAEQQMRLWTAARNVVAARYAGGDDGWTVLKNAIADLEDIVGRPK